MPKLSVPEPTPEPATLKPTRKVIGAEIESRQWAFELASSLVWASVKTSGTHAVLVRVRPKKDKE
jgi:hypothetical protein